MKTISLAVNLEDNGLAWERLGGASKRRKCVTLMITVLENAGLLLPEVVHENKEVTVTSPNICKLINNTYNIIFCIQTLFFQEKSFSITVGYKNGKKCANFFYF